MPSGVAPAVAGGRKDRRARSFCDQSHGAFALALVVDMAVPRRLGQYVGISLPHPVVNYDFLGLHVSKQKSAKYLFALFC